MGKRTFRILILTLCLLPSVAGAQLVTGMGRAGLTITASLAVPVQLKVRPLGEPRAVRHEAAFTEYALDVSASANVDWEIAVALGEPARAGTAMQVLSEDGTWEELSASDLTGEFAARGGPSNASPFVLRFRVLGGELPRIRLIMTPAETAR